MLYIMRHGKTDWNAKHKLQGSVDIPLNEEGRQMARTAREQYGNISFDVCYCSPLCRAKETAELFLEGTHTSIVVDERLREMGFGNSEGVENVFSKPDCPVYNLFKNPAGYQAQDGAESLEQLYARTGAFIKEVLEPVRREGKNILVVGHGAMNCSILNQYKRVPLKDFWLYMHGNCELIPIEEHMFE